MRKIVTTILMVLTMAAVNAKSNTLLGMTYEMNEGSNKYIQVRNIPGCENMTTDEIDAAYNEYKAEMKKQNELLNKPKVAKPTYSKAATIAKMVRENPFNLRVVKNFDINVNKNYQWPTDYICMNNWDPYNIAWQRNAK